MQIKAIFDRLYFSYFSNSVACDNRGNISHDDQNNYEISYNILNLPYNISAKGGGGATYQYLSDGTKYNVLDYNGRGYLYLGSLIYTVQGHTSVSLESATVSGGRILVSEGSSGRVYTPAIN